MAVYLHAGRFASAEYKHSLWSVVLEEGQDYKSLFKPEFWSHVAAQLRIGDIVHVRNDENTMFAQLYVHDCGRLYASMKEVSKVEFGAREAKSVDGEYYAKWAGPHHKFSIYRRADNERIKEGFPTVEEASAAALGMAKAAA